MLDNDILSVISHLQFMNEYKCSIVFKMDGANSAKVICILEDAPDNHIHAISSVILNYCVDMGFDYRSRNEDGKYIIFISL